MSALHWYTRNGKSWTDQPECVSLVIRSLCINLNDRLLSDADRERVIGPHLFAPVGTNTGVDDEIKRAFLCADRSVRVFAPYALRAMGLEVEAVKLESLPAIVDEASAARAESAESAASAARAARAWGWYESQMIRLILDCCAVGKKAEVRPTKSQEEVVEFLCSFEKK